MHWHDKIYAGSQFKKGFLRRLIKRAIVRYAEENIDHYVEKYRSQDNSLPIVDKCVLELWCQIKERLDAQTKKTNQ